MIDRNDLLKLGIAISAIAGAITSHALQLPPAWAPYQPYIEFGCGIVAIVSAVLIRPPQQGAK